MAVSTQDEKDTKDLSPDERNKRLVAQSKRFSGKISAEYKPSRQDADEYVRQQRITLTGKAKVKREVEYRVRGGDNTPSQNDGDVYTQTQVNTGTEKEGQEVNSNPTQEQEEVEEEQDNTKNEQEPDDSAQDKEEEPDKNNPTQDKGPERTDKPNNLPPRDQTPRGKPNQPVNLPKQSGRPNSGGSAPATPNVPAGGARGAMGGAAGAAALAQSGLNPVSGAQVATQQASRRALYWAYGALFTLVGSIPAFIYLNIHLWKGRKGGSKWFAPLQTWDKIFIVLLDFIVFIGFLLNLVIMVGSVVVYCNTWTGWASSKISSVIGPGDFCAALQITNMTGGGSSGGGGATEEWKGKIEFVISSAYRAGGETAENRPSAHGRGEAVDIAFRNPTLGLYQSDERIAIVMDAARRAGFSGLAGDVLDEYTNPARNATGGHIHMEFNVKGDGSSYCDNGSRLSSPPNDLVSIRGAVGGVQITASDPRLRPCMLAAFQRFLQIIEEENSTEDPE